MRKGVMKLTESSLLRPLAITFALLLMVHFAHAGTDAGMQQLSDQIQKYGRWIAGIATMVLTIRGFIVMMSSSQPKSSIMWFIFAILAAAIWYALPYFADDIASAWR